MPSIGYMPQARRALTQMGISGLDFVLTAAGGHRWGWPVASAAEKEAAWKALEEVGATDLARRPLAELSGGERQRILIAQALIGDPQLLLLDEPLISLDAAHQRTIIDLVHEVGERLGIAVLFCSHEINPLLRAVDSRALSRQRQGRDRQRRRGHQRAGAVETLRHAINVVRVAGRIFVMADDVELESGAHVHDV